MCWNRAAVAVSLLPFITSTTTLTSRTTTVTATAVAVISRNSRFQNSVAFSGSFSTKKTITSSTSSSRTQQQHTLTTSLIHRSYLSSSLSSSFSTMSDSNPLTIIQIPCLDDNYGYLVHDERTGHTAAIDTPDAGPYERVLKEQNWKLTHILNTHHHWDHTGGNVQLKEIYKDAVVYGPETERIKIPCIDIGLKHDDILDTFGGRKVRVIDVGGHTHGHIAYYFPKTVSSTEADAISHENIAFTGDSLFALGCGRMFEGTPKQFWKSLQNLRDLPDETLVYCAHEYTSANAKFALSVEPNNVELVERCKTINELRSQKKPTVPSLLGLEKRTNPFLRCDISTEIRTNVGVDDNKDTQHEAFHKVRLAKDNFRG